MWICKLKRDDLRASRQRACVALGCPEEGEIESVTIGKKYSGSDQPWWPDRGRGRREAMRGELPGTQDFRQWSWPVAPVKCLHFTNTNVSKPNIWQINLFKTNGERHDSYPSQTSLLILKCILLVEHRRGLYFLDREECWQEICSQP